jgi:hypothetical protein
VTPSFAKIRPTCQSNSRVRAHRRFEFKKSAQLFIGVHNETLSVAAMCVGNPGCSPVSVDSLTT